MTDHLVCTGRCRCFYFEGCDRMFRVCVLVWQSGWGRRKTERSFVSADFRLLRHKLRLHPDRHPRSQSEPDRAEQSRAGTEHRQTASSPPAEPSQPPSPVRTVLSDRPLCMCVCVRKRESVCVRAPLPSSLSCKSAVKRTCGQTYRWCTAAATWPLYDVMVYMPCVTFMMRV